MLNRPPNGHFGSNHWTTAHPVASFGFDTHARLLETVVLVPEGGDEMVIHAMPARKQYWDLLP
jgi:hypothetical protein